MTISIVIPTYQPGRENVEALQARLRAQTWRPDELVIVDSSSTDGSYDAWDASTVRLRIPQEEFDHGGTRNVAAARASGDVLVFMTQDAVPADDRWLEALVAPLVEGRAAAAYSRQVAREGAVPTERFLRKWNYPETSQLRCPEARDEARTIRRTHFSNVSAAYRADAFREVGGFPTNAIVNEDVVLATKLLDSGRCVAYVAESRVVHSHAYDLPTQFRRYFDIGVALRRDGPDLRSGGTQREGMRFVREQLRYLVDEGAYAWLPVAIAEAGAKYLGYRLGRAEDRLPYGWRRAFSVQKTFWDRNRGA